MIEIIRRKQPIPPLPFVLLFLFYIPHYVYNFSVTGPKDKNREENRPKHFKKLWISIAEFFIIWILLYFIFTYVDIPWKLTVSVFRGWWGIPIVICTGIVVLMIFKLAAAVINIMPVLFNILGGYNFQYYENGAFKATSISEFWRRWNVWGNEWFFTYFYRPLRRKMHFTHSQAMLTVFTFSALIHAAVIAYVNPQWAWLTFLAFFLNGLVTVFEAPALKHFPFIAKWPTWVNYILTFIFLDITMGLFGLCFS
jgi:D-alanyl-lipoteichoic acid acyltransferase DltB (MBOAT superfamily)